MFGHDDQQQPTTTDTAAPVTVDEPTTAAPAATDTATSPYIAADEPTVPRADLASTAAGGGNDDLLNIKQQALRQLSPLVDHLDQTPEERFRTTMMMIQASDDQNLIKSAYEAAQAITDEKTRAQALLDIVNEINYFTQHPGEN